MSARDGHYDAPAYCALCDRPINIGPLCHGCEVADDEHLESDYDDRNGGDA